MLVRRMAWAALVGGFAAIVFSLFGWRGSACYGPYGIVADCPDMTLWQRLVAYIETLGSSGYAVTDQLFNYEFGPKILLLTGGLLVVLLSILVLLLVHPTPPSPEKADTPVHV